MGSLLPWTLGRILLQPVPQGGSHISYEIVDLPDGRFEERKAHMESLIKIVMAAFEKGRR